MLHVSGSPYSVRLLWNPILYLFYIDICWQVSVLVLYQTDSQSHFSCLSYIYMWIKSRILLYIGWHIFDNGIHNRPNKFPSTYAETSTGRQWFWLWTRWKGNFKIILIKSVFTLCIKVCLFAIKFIEIFI
jgi:hypothetical protein